MTEQIKLHLRPIAWSYGLFDHYFLVIKDTEYHLGEYPKGTKLPVGTTKNSSILYNIEYCKDCYNKLLLDIETQEHKRLFSFFPFVNCETLATGLSIQSINLWFFPIIVYCLCSQRFLLAILIFLLCLLLQVVYSKYQMIGVRKKKCEHIF